MDKEHLEQLRQKREEKKRQDEEKKRQTEQLSAVKESGSAIVEAVKSSQPKIEDLAKSQDVQSVVESINRLNVTTFIASKDSWADVVESMAVLSEKMQKVVNDLESGGVKKLEDSFVKSVANLQRVVDRMKAVRVEADQDMMNQLQKIAISLESLDIKPTFNVPPAKVTISERDIDFTPILETLRDVNAGIATISAKETVFDTKEINDGLVSIEQAVRDLIARPIPIPEHPLPFKNTSGQGVQALVDNDGHVQIDVNATSGLIDFAYNYISVAYPTSTTEVYTYKTGGSSGTTVATITVTYTDSTKANISTVART